MSEYQYYEFLAVDQPLSKDDMASLHRISSRAEISPTRFTNHYEWGDLKGEPLDFMRRWFDVHVYVANWMTAIFMVRVPISALSENTVEAMTVQDILEFEATETHWIITWILDESENYDRFGAEDGTEWMARLTPIRDELLRGDVRSLYLGWLAAVGRGMMDEEESEPLSVPGLGELTDAQHALAEFIEVDPDLLTGAGVGSSSAGNQDIPESTVNDWIAALPTDFTGEVIRLLLGGEGMKAEATLRSRFLDYRRSLEGEKNSSPTRTVAELLKNAEAAREQRHQQEQREREEIAQKLQETRDAYLKAMSGDYSRAWKAVRQEVARGTATAYDEVSRMLLDLSDSYATHATNSAFREELSRFLSENPRRRALLQRLVKAGLWKH
jgi:hypothetical protein